MSNSLDFGWIFITLYCLDFQLFVKRSLSRKLGGYCFLHFSVVFCIFFLFFGIINLKCKIIFFKMHFIFCFQNDGSKSSKNISGKGQKITWKVQEATKLGILYSFVCFSIFFWTFLIPKAYISWQLLLTPHELLSALS